jgi:hypothetical protein
MTHNFDLEAVIIERKRKSSMRDEALYLKNIKGI